MTETEQDIDFVAEYNNLVEEAALLGNSGYKPVKRFSDRATAEKRLRMMSETVEAIKSQRAATGSSTTAGDQPSPPAPKPARAPKPEGDKPAPEPKVDKGVFIREEVPKGDASATGESEMTTIAQKASTKFTGKKKSDKKAAKAGGKPNTNARTKVAGKTKKASTGTAVRFSAVDHSANAAVKDPLMEAILGSRVNTNKGTLLAIFLKNKGKKLALGDLVKQVYGKDNEDTRRAFPNNVAAISGYMEQKKVPYEIVRDKDKDGGATLAFVAKSSKK